MQMADKIIMRPVEALIPYTRNARTHSRVAARVAGPGRDCIGLELSPGYARDGAPAHRIRRTATAPSRLMARSSRLGRDPRRENGRIRGRAPVIQQSR